MAVPINAATELRNTLDRDGCAYGQVSRERMAHLQTAIDDVRSDLRRLESKLNYVLSAIALQLLAFALGVVAYILQRAH